MNRNELDWVFFFNKGFVNSSGAKTHDPTPQGRMQECCQIEWRISILTYLYSVLYQKSQEYYIKHYKDCWGRLVWHLTRAMQMKYLKSWQLLHHPHDLKKCSTLRRNMQVLKTKGLKNKKREIHKGTTTYLVDSESIDHLLWCYSSALPERSRTKQSVLIAKDLYYHYKQHLSKHL